MLLDNDDDQLAFADRALNPKSQMLAGFIMNGGKMNLGQTMEKNYLTNWKLK